jgi:hypothetical protein
LRHYFASIEVFEPTSSLRIGDTAPDFAAPSTKGHIQFHEFLGKDNGSWCVVLFHPKDFSPVCTTELGQAAKLQRQVWWYSSDHYTDLHLILIIVHTANLRSEMSS